MIIMKLGTKYLGLLIGILLAILTILIALYFLNPTSTEHSKDNNEPSANAPLDEVDTKVWNELANFQQANGSWDNNLETTQIAANALTQSNDVVQQSEKVVTYDREGNINEDDEKQIDNYISKNAELVNDANNWTLDNYQEDEPIFTQSLVNMHFGLCSQRVDSSSKYVDITIKTNNVIISSQNYNGSWNDDVQQTAISIFVLKMNNASDQNAIQKGEGWLISKQQTNKGVATWGSVLNNSLAILALYNTSYDISIVVNNLISNQLMDGSFGDVETTAWAVIALSIYNSDEQKYSDALKLARKWLLTQDNLSTRELAVVSLAEVQYLMSKIIGAPVDDDIPDHDKGLTIKDLAFTGIMLTGGCSIILLIVFIRLSAEDALEGARSKIFDYLKLHPGSSQNVIKRRLGLSSSSLRHHLRILEKYDYIIQHNDGKYIRYYPNRNGYSIYTNGNGYKEIISALRKDTAANIVKYIQENPNTTQQGLAKALDIHPSTVHWHTKILLATNIISQKRAGKSVQYEVKEPIDLDKLMVLAS